MHKIELNKIIAEFPSIECHPKLIRDIEEIIMTGNEKMFLRIFLKRLRELCEYGHRAPIECRSNFEKLKHNNNLYSMHIEKSKAFNIRILYSFFNNNKVLLHAFYEKSGKNKTDYTIPIKTANQRIKVKWER